MKVTYRHGWRRQRSWPDAVRKNVWHFGKLQKLQLPFTAGKKRERRERARARAREKQTAAQLKATIKTVCNV